MPIPRHDDVTQTMTPTRSTSTRAMLAAFAPYLIASAAHLVILGGGPGWAITATKALLMPLLVLAVAIVARPLAGATARYLVLAIVLSWAGDIALSFPGTIGFVVGLGCFLGAHVVYIALFLGMPRARRRPPAWTLGYLAWYAGFLALLGPHSGALLVPVALYGLVLAANDEPTLDDFAPGDLAGPLELPAGTYTVAITAADAADASSPAIGPITCRSRRA
ncbi:hypothetical protein GCM10023152_21340 [Agromyces bauzanensis]|uniref:Lysoplasmalogenase n=1 Tax=Agromyces bauzanensis TaxID=1308924 RepID=A0A917UR23_9MICO|nr:hypothetical protein GCM10011372_15280 [Agromyces bauzanensis]